MGWKSNHAYDVPEESKYHSIMFLRDYHSF